MESKNVVSDMYSTYIHFTEYGELETIDKERSERIIESVSNSVPVLLLSAPRLSSCLTSFFDFSPLRLRTSFRCWVRVRSRTSTRDNIQ